MLASDLQLCDGGNISFISIVDSDCSHQCEEKAH